MRVVGCFLERQIDRENVFAEFIAVQRLLPGLQTCAGPGQEDFQSQPGSPSSAVDDIPNLLVVMILRATPAALIPHLQQQTTAQRAL
jgi:hypothetical protein